MAMDAEAARWVNVYDGTDAIRPLFEQGWAIRRRCEPRCTRQLRRSQNSRFIGYCAPIVLG